MEDISEVEINARIMALITQRNRALDESVVLMSRIAMLEHKTKELEEELKVIKESAPKETT